MVPDLDEWVFNLQLPTWITACMESQVMHGMVYIQTLPSIISCPQALRPPEQLEASVGSMAETMEGMKGMLSFMSRPWSPEKRKNLPLDWVQTPVASDPISPNSVLKSTLRTMNKVLEIGGNPHTKKMLYYMFGDSSCTQDLPTPYFLFGYSFAFCVITSCM